MSTQPALLHLDEITAAPEPEFAATSHDRAAGGMTMISATDVTGVARELAVKGSFLQGGVVHEEGPPLQIFSHPPRNRRLPFHGRTLDAGRP
ncbi:hypothetical protein [Limimaricola pyoseonensis]|uniref:hypothetical protein n=1 Tax=Limimaricola pyoseonensis TaxID=521013 RepID=UPI0010426F55|nr:hypothetical protein [Limimaricola pyoseonensis]